MQSLNTKNTSMSNYRLLKKRKAEKILDKIKNNSPSINYVTIKNNKNILFTKFFKSIALDAGN